jgi:uncharacterized membrane protein YoaK (UPF0700 family)
MAHLFALTFVTGVIDAASYLGMGHTFTANMTGNVIFLGFALAGAPGISVARCALAVAGFVTGAALAGRVAAGIPVASRSSRMVRAGLVEAAVLGLASLLSAALRGAMTEAGGRLSGVIVLAAFAMGIRNATVRALAVPDMTTTVLTMTLTGLAADSAAAAAACAASPRWPRRVGSVLTMTAGAVSGVLLLRVGLWCPLAFSAGVGAASTLALRRRGEVSSG